ncbi:MAG: phage major capsid protein [Clostridia bacterium]|nr:phage major capsid protein [Clostridia bacterium]
MNKIYDMKQDRAKLVAQMREIMDRNDGAVMSAEDAAAYDQIEKKFDALNASILREERQQERERGLEQREARKEAGELSDNMKLFAKALSGNAGDVAAYRNDVSYTLGADATAGALSAPMQFVEELIKGLDDEIFLRQLAHKTPSIGAAQSLGFPYIVEDADEAEWTEEITPAAEEQKLKFGRREFKPRRMDKLIKLSKTLVSHSNLAPQGVLDRLNYKIGITQEKAYMTGDGENKPLGIFTTSDSGIPTSRDVAAASATAISFDDLLDVKYKLKGQYQRRAAWIMHRDLVKRIAKLKNNDGQYIWQPSTQAGQPDRLLGAGVYMSEYAPNTYAADKYAAVFGDFSFYWICDADELYLQVLNELFAINNQVGYLSQYFGDGAPVMGEAFARLKMGA